MLQVGNTINTLLMHLPNAHGVGGTLNNHFTQSAALINSCTKSPQLAMLVQISYLLTNHGVTLLGERISRVHLSQVIRPALWISDPEPRVRRTSRTIYMTSFGSNFHYLRMPHECHHSWSHVSTK